MFNIVELMKQKTDYLYSPGQVLCFTSPELGINHAIIKCCNYNFKKGSVFQLYGNKNILLPQKRKEDPLYVT